MKLITQKEVANYQVKTARHGKSKCMTDLISIASTMSVGEAILVNKEEWTNKGVPNLSKELSGKKFAVRTLVDNTGWVIKRAV